MKTLEDLFENQLKDLYSAESQLIDALPGMIKKANNNRLKEAFESHFEETKEQKERLEGICRVLKISPEGERCRAMEGLIKEAKSLMESTTTDEVMDAALIAEAQRVEHYEIAGYGTAVRYAKELGHSKVAETLQISLDEEYDADNTLDKLAEKWLNRKAISGE